MLFGRRMLLLLGALLILVLATARPTLGGPSPLPEERRAPLSAFSANEAVADEAVDENCFVRGTLVLTKDGRRPIEQLRPGDQVLAADDVTGEKAWKPIVRVFEGRTDQVVELTIGAISSDGARPQAAARETSAVRSTAGGDAAADEPPASQRLRCSPEHPFAVPGRRWVSASELRVGDELVGSRGERLFVEKINVAREAAPTWNLEVEGHHTFFVAGSKKAPAVWVHNTDVQILKSIRRHAEKLVKKRGRAAGASVQAQRHVRRTQAALARGDRTRAGTHFHSLNAHYARAAQRKGHLTDIDVNMKKAIPPGGFKSSRIPDYLKRSTRRVYDLKPRKPSAGHYNPSPQFQDLRRAGYNPTPLYYKL